MKVSNVILLEEVKVDLLAGKMFYNFNEEGVGMYFYDCLLSDIESLLLYAGIHSKHHGFSDWCQKNFLSLFITMFKKIQRLLLQFWI